MRENLIKEGHHPGDHAAAHHIVPSTAARAEPARNKLKSFGIDINSTDNGMFLPTSKESKLEGTIHKGRHTNGYIDQVNFRLAQIPKKEEVSEKDVSTVREDVKEVLGTIKRKLRAGTMGL